MTSYEEISNPEMALATKVSEQQPLINSIPLLTSAIKPEPLTLSNEALKCKENLQATLKSKNGKKNKIWIEAYGCSASKADSEMIMGQLKNCGYDIATCKEESSLNLIVTCSVKDATEHKMLFRINRLASLGKPIIVAGCLPKADKNKIESLFPYASLLGPNSIDKTIDVVNSGIAGQKMVALEDSPSDKVNVPKIRINSVIGIVEIASGCLSECSFCQTKIAKGSIRSYRIGDILRQIRHDISEGCKEIWLTSTDNGCYGKDIGSNLVELLRSCCQINGNYKIRVGMMNPMHLCGMTQELLEVYVGNDKIFKFLHIPVQSGSDRILRKMKRGHTIKIYRDLVKAFRSKIPEMTIATDIIVGFPSETDDDFEKTLTLIKETEPDIINSSKYSPRANTAAAKLRQLSSDIIKKRSKKLHLLAKEISMKRNSIWKGWKGKIIIDETVNSNTMQGRNYAYKPVLVTSSTRSSRYSLTSRHNYILGSEITTQIQSYSNYSLRGVPFG